MAALNYRLRDPSGTPPNVREGPVVIDDIARKAEQFEIIGREHRQVVYRA
jgi:hypothetical protein